MNRRNFLKNAVVLSAAASHGRAARAAAHRTVVSIEGDNFLLNGRPTYPGRSCNGKPVAGLLFISRMANAIVDDQNPQTKGVWAYRDGPWDPDRNTNEFIAALPAYRACGLTAVAINMQGGSPQGYSWHQPWQLSGFSPDGILREDYKARAARVLDAADALGIVVNLGLFYVSAKPALANEAAVIKAVDQVTEFVCAGGWTHVLIEVGNEVDLPPWNLDIVKPARCHELIERIQKSSKGWIANPARRLLVSTSFLAAPIPDNYLVAADYVLVHGNAMRSPNDLRAFVTAIRQSGAYRGQPILFNEDDHFDFDKSDNNMLAAIDSHAGWGFFDYRQSRERFVDGYQSLPVDWSISSQRKKEFFTALARVTGGHAP